MLTKLILKNFQIHRLLSLQLNPLVTVLVGESDRGKSSVLRALKWICLNRPSGDAFLRHGSTEVRVALRADGHKIVRTKRAGKNVLRLDDHQFSALGKGGVPDEAARLLNVDEVNFQDQHAASWWFHDSPGQVSKNLNAIVNLDLIDRTLANLASELRKAKTVSEITEQRLTSSIAQCDKLTWVQLAHKELSELESMSEELAQKRSRIDSLGSLIEKLSGVLSIQQNSAEQLKMGAAAVAAGEKVLKIRAQREKLQEVLSKWQDQRSREKEARAFLTSVTAELEEQLQGTCPVCLQEIPQSKR